MNEQPEVVAPKRGRPAKLVDAIVEPKKTEVAPPAPPEQGQIVSVADIVQTFKSQGLPVSAAHFHQAIRAEAHFYSDGNPANSVVSRKAAMFITPLGLIVEQKGKRVAVVPHANIIFCEL